MNNPTKPTTENYQIVAEIESRTTAKDHFERELDRHSDIMTLFLIVKVALAQRMFIADPNAARLDSTLLKYIPFLLAGAAAHTH